MELAPVPNVAFAGTACFACYRAPPNTAPLQRCSGCKRVKFCSSDCSKSEWKDHKPFCLAFSSVRSRPNAFLPPLYSSTSPIDIANRRQTHRAQWLLEDELLQAGLHRDPTVLESKLLWREPRCGVCWDREADVEGRDEKVHEIEEEIGAGVGVGKGKWRVCKGCRVMPWCSEEHEKEGREEHCETEGEDGRTQCQTYQLSNEIDEFMIRHSLATGDDSPPKLWVPSRSLTTSTPLPPSWSAYLHSVALPSPTPSLAEIYGVFLEALSPVLTILAGLRRFGIDETSPKLSIRLLEETHQTLSTWIPAFEELQHQLPQMKHLDLIAISPGDDSKQPSSSTSSPKPTPLPLCPTCLTSHRTRSITHHINTPPSTPSTLSISLNSSLAQSHPSSPFWPTQLQSLFLSRTPLIFTAQTEEESNDDLTVLLDQVKKSGLEGKVEVVWGVERNLWSGGWPRVDGWEEDGVWRKNGWWFGVRVRE